MTRLEHAARAFLTNQRKDLQLLEKKLISPIEVVKQIQARLEKMNLRMQSATQTLLHQAEFRLKNCMSLLDSLSPLNVVDRGYSITTKGKNVVKSVKEIHKNDSIQIKLKDGTLSADVTDIQLNKA